MAVTETNRLLQHLRRSVGPLSEPGDGQLLDSFLVRRDGEAFAALMRRHGPMVWGVCRRLAGHEQDAEDAFQATFLILVRRAESVWPRDHVGNWLHGVAFRTARKARQLADRRRVREQQLAGVPQPLVQPIEPNGDLRLVLDRELARLPEKLRLPLLLCDLEGRSQREVARQLGLPVGTLCHRLQSGRALLAKRLTRRGVALAATALAVTSVPRSLAAVTLRAASQLSAGRELASVVPPQIVALSHGAVSVMTPSKSRLVLALLLVAVLGGLGFGTNWSPLLAGDNPPAPKPAAPPRQPAKEDQIDDATFLRRISLDLRGVLPTMLETKYFLADKDPKKRRKVVEWMLEKADRDKVIDRVRYYYRLKANEGRPEDAKREDLFRELLVKPDDKNRQDAIIELLWNEDDRDIRLYWDELLQEKVNPDKDHLKYWRDQLHNEKLNLNDMTDDDLRKTVSDADTLKAMIAWLQKGEPQKPAPPRDQIDPSLARAIEFLRRNQPSGEVPDKDVVSLLRWIYASNTDQPADDAAFLRRVMQDLAGVAPTHLELKYFQSDSDANKRQKVVGWLLNDPVHAKKLALKWKESVGKESARTQMALALIEGRSHPLSGLLDRVLQDNKTNDQILDALTLAALARYPTETERSFALASVSKSENRKAAWSLVMKALTSTSEFRHHAEALQRAAK